MRLGEGSVLNRERKDDYRNRFLAYLHLALDLEKDAIERYTNHITVLNDPDLVAYLEGVLRTELRHLEEIAAEIARIEGELEQ